MDLINQIFSGDSIESSMIFILLGLFLIIYAIERKDGFNFEEFGFFDWQFFFTVWVLV